MEINLILFREDGSRRVFPLPPGVTTIGRKQDCSIRIPLAMVSRRHAEILVEDNGIVLRDLGAANGTFLNNRKVSEEDLEAGDQIMIGPVILTVQVNGEPPDENVVHVRSRAPTGQAAKRGGPSVGASKHVYVSDDDPISALEALASSADQTAIGSNDEDDILSP
jgi:pSer/pThr/pTyr-binding forkhead associated (FHA) protein